MREIKFRAWDEAEQLYRNEGSVQFDGMIVSGWGKDKPEWILEQYTGQKDKNGKEIYDGDILENIDPPGMENCITSVVWNNIEACWFVENDDLNIYDPIYNVTGYCSVIGNIHEHPELLK